VRRGLLLLAQAALPIAYYVALAPPRTPADVFAPKPWWLSLGGGARSAWLEPLVELANAGGGRTALALSICFAPPLLLAALGARSLGPGARLCATSLAAAACLLATAALAIPSLWQPAAPAFFGLGAALAVTLGGTIHLPALAQAMWRRSRIAAVAALAGVGAGVVLLSTELTGNDPEAYSGASPWPLLPVFGLGVLCLGIAALQVAGGASALLSRALRPGSRQVVLGGALGAALAAVFAAGFGLEDPLVPGAALGVLGAVYGIHHTRAGGRLGGMRLACGLGLAAVILGSQEAARLFEARVREGEGAELLGALEAHRRERGDYPDALANLVPDFLPRVPAPRIGWIRDPYERFHYANFGETFALEFASTRWVQCTFTPVAPSEAEELDSALPRGAELPEEVSEWELAQVGAGQPKARGAEGPPPGRWSCAREGPTLR
jgi:hypothetical protein